MSRPLYNALSWWLLLMGGAPLVPGDIHDKTFEAAGAWLTYDWTMHLLGLYLLTYPLVRRYLAIRRNNRSA